MQGIRMEWSMARHTDNIHTRSLWAGGKVVGWGEGRPAFLCMRVLFLCDLGSVCMCECIIIIIIIISTSVFKDLS